MIIGYSMKTAALAFDPPLSVNAIRSALRSGELKSKRLGRQRIITRDALVTWAEALPTYAAPRRIEDA